MGNGQGQLFDVHEVAQHPWIAREMAVFVVVDLRERGDGHVHEPQARNARQHPFRAALFEHVTGRLVQDEANGAIGQRTGGAEELRVAQHGDRGASEFVGITDGRRRRRVLGDCARRNGNRDETDQEEKDGR